MHVCFVQVYQAIRSCRGVAPVLILGASELPKLVAPAEAWAVEACRTLKIKVFALQCCQRRQALMLGAGVPSFLG